MVEGRLPGEGRAAFSQHTHTYSPSCEEEVGRSWGILQGTGLWERKGMGWADRTD